MILTTSWPTANIHTIGKIITNPLKYVLPLTSFLLWFSSIISTTKASRTIIKNISLAHFMLTGVITLSLKWRNWTFSLYVVFDHLWWVLLYVHLKWSRWRNYYFTVFSLGHFVWIYCITVEKLECIRIMWFRYIYSIIELILLWDIWIYKTILSFT